MVRHGEIPSNINKIYAGKSPERLTDKGINQAMEVAERLRTYNIHSLYSSPVQRAIQTGEIISRKIRKNVLIHNAFREMEFGPWEGLSEHDIARHYPEEWNLWQKSPAELKLPGRETLDTLLERVLTGVQKIYRDTGARIVVVTHVAVIRVLMLWYTKKSLNLYKTIPVPNAGIFQFKIDTYP